MTAASEDPIVAFEDVSFRYRDYPVLEDVNLKIQPKEFAWIVGPNGGGKTTLVKLMLGLYKPATGRITVFGTSPVNARPRIGYMPQHAHLDLNFPVTVLDVALMGCIGNKVKAGPFSTSERKSAFRALEAVGLKSLMRRALSELSGGEQRRLLIARALACDPQMLVLDEPTANLDRKVERELFDILRRLNQQLTIVMVSHDPAFVSDFVEQVICVNRTVAVHPTAAMQGDSILELYGTPRRIVRHDKQHHGEGADS
jgi:zinc transport system ATP-binding protein